MLVEQIVHLIRCVLGGTKKEVLYTLTVFLGVLLSVRCIQWLKYVRSLPPGPYGLPIIGYLPFIKNDVLHYKNLAKKYGSVLSISLGNKLVVVISDYRIIRETFRREDFASKPDSPFMQILGGYGIINAVGALWKEQRKFVHENLRKFGMTFLDSRNQTLQKTIKREINSLVGRLNMLRGKPVNLAPHLSNSMSNVICSIIMGVHFPYGDRQFTRFMNLIDEGFKLFGRIALVNYIPILRYLPGPQYVLNKISQNITEMSEFFQKNIDEHKATFNENNIRDILDTYLLEIQEAKKTKRVLFEGRDHDRQMQQILGDLFSAGMETVKNTLEWAMLFMLYHPKAAQAVQKELDQVIGRSRMPTLDDLSLLPITGATIQEVLRRSTVVPFGTPHATTRDVTVKGYNIPAGSEILASLYSVHMDPELWGDPEAFRPSRFISSEGKVFKPDYFMPFGVGRRMCLGDVLARMELFLFFSSLMHAFNIKVPEGAPMPSLKGDLGATLAPIPFEICLLPREFASATCDSNEVSTNGPVRNIGSH